MLELVDEGHVFENSLFLEGVASRMERDSKAKLLRGYHMTDLYGQQVPERDRQSYAFEHGALTRKGDL